MESLHEDRLASSHPTISHPSSGFLGDLEDTGPTSDHEHKAYMQGKKERRKTGAIENFMVSLWLTAGVGSADWDAGRYTADPKTEPRHLGPRPASLRIGLSNKAQLCRRGLTKVSGFWSNVEPNVRCT